MSRDLAGWNSLAQVFPVEHPDADPGCNSSRTEGSEERLRRQNFQRQHRARYTRKNDLDSLRYAKNSESPSTNPRGHFINCTTDCSFFMRTETAFPVLSAGLSAPDSASRTGPAPDCDRLGGYRRSVIIAGAWARHITDSRWHLPKRVIDVTVVYLHSSFHQGDLAEWTRLFPNARDPTSSIFPSRREAQSGTGIANRNRCDCYQWLRDQPAFDVIHFHEWLGVPYYSLVAKKFGTRVRQYHAVRRNARPDALEPRGRRMLVSRAEDLVVDFMERKSIELADVVVSPSQHLLQWMRDDGWILPERSYVANNILQPLEIARRRWKRSPDPRTGLLRTPGSPQGRFRSFAM